MSQSQLQESAGTSDGSATVLYCHCAYAKVVPKDVRDEALRGLAESGRAFEAVPDLCELSARKDPALARFAKCGPLKVVACYPRAVRWLFHAAGEPIDVDKVEVLNMRTQSAEELLERALAPDLRPSPTVDESAPAQSGEVGGSGKMEGGEQQS